jgi:hypothetical protein
MQKQSGELTYHPLVYETRDSETASVLASQNQRFTSELKQGSVWFTFENKEACEAIIDAHINGELTITSRDLTSAMHEIKKIIIRHKHNDND